MRKLLHSIYSLIVFCLLVSTSLKAMETSEPLAWINGQPVITVAEFQELTGGATGKKVYAFFDDLIISELVGLYISDSGIEQRSLYQKEFKDINRRFKNDECQLALQLKDLNDRYFFRACINSLKQRYMPQISEEIVQNCYEEIKTILSENGQSVPTLKQVRPAILLELLIKECGEELVKQELSKYVETLKKRYNLLINESALARFVK